MCGASLAVRISQEPVLGEAFSYTTCLALSADGSYLHAGTARGEICRWRVAERTLLATLSGHSGAIRGVAVSGNGQPSPVLVRTERSVSGKEEEGRPLAILEDTREVFGAWH